MAVLPESGRLAGIDYGSVRIGVALCDPERILASPYETRTRTNREKDAVYFQQLVESERLVGFVVGLPVHASGDESPKSQEARAFGAWLHEQTGLPVEFFDERYTTVEAERYLLQAQMTKKKRKQRLDSVAAQVILSAFLESSQRGAPQSLD